MPADEVTLREITEDTVLDVLRLEVAPEQERFVAPNSWSLAQALFAPHAWYRAIYLGDEPVGFVMLADDSLRPERPEQPELALWRFMLDRRHQGKGVGTRALRLVIDHARSRGTSDVLLVSFVPGDGSPEGLYLRAGFRHTGLMDDDELVLALPLREGMSAADLPREPDDLEFATARLKARRWRDSDLGPLLRVYGDADAMRWVGDGSPLTHGEATRWLEVTRQNYARRGYGMYALEERSGGDVVGFVGIVHPGGQEESEVKYALARERWGDGLATEAVRGAVMHAAHTLGLPRLIATAAPENAASHRVLEKAGFRRGEPRVNDDGSRTLVFARNASRSG